MIVELVGLELLTNAFGVLLMFQGVAAAIGSPLLGKYIKFIYLFYCTEKKFRLQRLQKYIIQSYEYIRLTRRVSMNIRTS